MYLPLRTLLVDDEPNARTRLRRLLQNDERVEIIGEASDGLEAVAEIAGLRPHLSFLDVQMPGAHASVVSTRALKPFPRSAPHGTRSCAFFRAQVHSLVNQYPALYLSGWLTIPETRQREDQMPFCDL